MNFFKKLIKKEKKPNVYGLLLRGDDVEYLYVCVAYSLEEAITISKREMSKQHPALRTKRLKLELFYWISPEELFKDVTDHSFFEEVKKNGQKPPEKEEPEEPEEPEEKKEESRSDIMKRIISSGDVSLIQENKSKLREVDIRYIKDAIKRNEPNGKKK